ncbi:glutamate--cysteine ligase, partial [Anaerosalibacter bizertensis]
EILMDYIKQVKEIEKYFKDNEKEEKDFKIGVEFEHFIIDKDSLKTISYYGDNGVEETLEELVSKGWKDTYEGKYLLGLNKNGTTITLEPGSQFELSIGARKDIKEIEKEYFNVLNEIVPILERKNQALITIGYQPETKISDIKILPKQRYAYMYEYFKKRGAFAHNMMKGTASLQVSFDYKSEEDYIRKFKLANIISPVIYAIFDNAFYFEGETWNKRNLRTHIWENCDSDRCGIVDIALDKDFGYKKYAEYILNRPPIFIDDGEELYYTGNKPYKEIFNIDDYSIEELEHVLTMFFPDVRTKKYVEVRMMDSVPYPLNFSAIALLKGILYDEKNINNIYNYIGDIDILDTNKAKGDIIEKGLDGKLKDKTIYEIAKYIIEIAKSGLNEEEREYIIPLEKMISEKKTPYDITRDKDSISKKEALDWCIVNNLVNIEK